MTDARINAATVSQSVVASDRVRSAAGMLSATLERCQKDPYYDG
jgi:hypothetical protein